MSLSGWRACLPPWGELQAERSVDRLISGEGFSFDDTHPELGATFFPGCLDPDRAAEIYAEIFDDSDA